MNKPLDGGYFKQFAELLSKQFDTEAEVRTAVTFVAPDLLRISDDRIPKAIKTDARPGRVTVFLNTHGFIREVTHEGMWADPTAPYNKNVWNGMVLRLTDWLKGQVYEVATVQSGH